MKQKKQIIFFHRELHKVMGGAEKQLLKISKSFVNKGYKVTIVTLDKQMPDLYFNYDFIGIDFIQLSTIEATKKASMKERFNRQIKLYKLLKTKKFSVAISIMTGSYFFSFIPCLLARVPIILAERNSPEMYKITRNKKYRYFIFLLMIFAQIIVVQFETFKFKYPKYLRNKIKVIPNQIDKVSNTKKNKCIDNIKFTFVFAGRLSFQKQILLLIDSFFYHLNFFPDSQLKIYGEGYLENEMWKRIKLYKIEDNIVHIKGEKDPEKLFNGVDVLCCPSLWEGFPNTVAEALSCGVPVIGLTYCDGVNNLIKHSFNGWLVNKRSSELSVDFGICMNEIRQIPNLDEFKKNCVNSVSKYETDEIYNLWHELVISLT